jgi:pimeloyl-ACP methyl ester carboxylesterase
VFVACDHLGTGDSTVPEGNVLTYENITNANRATVDAVMDMLERGVVMDGYPSIRGAVKLGIGQSMGGCFTIVAQGQHSLFDGIGILGFSAIHTVVPSPPGSPTVLLPWMPRGTSFDAPVVANAAQLAEAEPGTVIFGDASLAAVAERTGGHPFAWAFHFDDEPADVVAADLAIGGDEPLPPWRSATTPPCVILMVAPGTVAPEAAAIRVPVLVVAGERDVVPDPWIEPNAYRSATDITVFVCPRMAHMHNFASTREILWSRLHSWGATVAQSTALARSG